MNNMYHEMRFYAIGVFSIAHKIKNAKFFSTFLEVPRGFLTQTQAFSLFYFLNYFLIYVKLINSIPFSPQKQEYRSPVRHVIIIASVIICAARGRGRCSFSAIILPKNLSRSSSSPRTHTGPVVVDFLCPPVDNDQHLPQWQRAAGQTRS